MTFQFYLAAIIFITTFGLIASEKVNKTSAALVGSALMLLFILPGPSHNGNDSHKSQPEYTMVQEITPPNLAPEQHDNKLSIDKIDTYAR